MKKTILLIAACMAATIANAADTLKVSRFRQLEPSAIRLPWQIDSMDIMGSAYDISSDALESEPALGKLRGRSLTEGLAAQKGSVHLASFAVQNLSFAKASIVVEGLDTKKVYVDGREKTHLSGIKLDPGTHEIAIYYYIGKESEKVPSVSVVSETPIALREDGRRIYSLDINCIGEQTAGVSLSPSGKFVKTGLARTLSDGKGDYTYEIRRTSDLSVIYTFKSRMDWMPSSDLLWFTRKNLTGGRSMVLFNPETLTESILVENLPEGQFEIAPTENFLIYSESQDGPKEGEVHEILEPGDRQPGWRDRSYISRYDIATGVKQRLTFGWHNSWLGDISDDGKKILVLTSRDSLDHNWPTALMSIYEMRLDDGHVECLVKDDGFIASAEYSPDASQILITSSPDGLGGIGRNLPEDRIASMIESKLYVMNLSDKSIRPITKDFAPSLLNCEWSRNDGKIYMVVEDKDCNALYRVDPRTAKAEKLDAKEDYVMSYFSLAKGSPMLAYYGQSLCNGHRSYLMDTRKGSQRMMQDISAMRLDGVDICQGGGFEFKSSRGDLLNSFYVLPQDFDPSKKYPMLVHYYGGCSPSTRYMIGSYSPHYYAAQGYVFLVVNPSGATGFGQEFASRHVNTAGEGVAEDIIETVQRFCEEHPFVNKEKIGCFSASYGGFMTQLLLEKTDMFAAGISHAGISDHTSYWGEGYWGYSYSEVSMSKSYPWTRTDLYVDRSTLFHADKVHTPLLFLHGSVDTNVPIGESIQMFTALKLLGAETAFVVVDGEDHHINEYNKRRQWLRTISAWFAKHLKDDPSWWDDMYPHKNL